MTLLIMALIVEEYFSTDHVSQLAINILYCVPHFSVYFFYLNLKFRYMNFHILCILTFCNAYVALKYDVLMFFSLLLIIFLLLNIILELIVLTGLHSAFQLFP